MSHEIEPDEQMPYSTGGVVRGDPVPGRLRRGERVYWSDGSVSEMTEDGLRLLPVHVEDQLRAELRDLAARDRAAAPSADEVLGRMAANGLIDPERD